MIRTIRQRIYGLALLPLALLAVTLLILNGFTRVEEAHNELRNGQRMVVELLQARAVESLVVGNVLAFDEVSSELLRNSSSIACIALEDIEQQVVSRHGMCGSAVSSADRFAVRALGEGLSDFDATAVATIGQISISMNEAPIRHKRQQIVLQLTISLLLIALVFGITQRLLRRRFVEPIEQIHVGMNALGEGAYHTRIPVRGDDELARLGHSINATIERIAAYTRELERRRDEASRALQEADDEGLARDALVDWLAEDLEGPLHAMQGELTAVAVANNDPSLKTGIRRALALLQDSLSAAHGPHSCPMSNTRIVRTRLPATTHTVVEAISRQQQLTESAWLRRLIETTLQSSGVVLQAGSNDEPPRQARLMIRLLADDRALLHARARARGMPMATYASVVIRSHLRGVAPLPKEERALLNQSIGQLTAIGRNLNQLARLANQGGRVVGPSREDLRTLLRACEALRNHVRQLVDANLRSWEAGHG